MINDKNPTPRKKVGLADYDLLIDALGKLQKINYSLQVVDCEPSTVNSQRIFVYLEVPSSEYLFYDG
ncbi:MULTISPECIES: hypothetical protein [unclassified Tolypothrix]|uniref:hypothetical protein n=1 Tax=unclassified Tolypothrix TaxID=2649714 RepID=UPI0012D8293A|nr:MULTISPECIES: hypothetical protein [unclassified Tolypothrix]MBE9087415.1 hypothetical protein [Tolypothrix sp. LEGE 11397]UYD24207.1 hypothetical protein HGR01_22285 [Tolypothrix sp. PCC 7712]UYD33565.1 hypothetical protein HG267_32425 [Tolypothrix sp. PCC 7601]